MILSDKNLRIRLILLFSTCIITSLVGLAHAIEIFREGYASRLYTAIIEVRPLLPRYTPDPESYSPACGTLQNNIALIVCNTPVILASIIDLKEAPWEERHLLEELRNLELESAPSPVDETGSHPRDNSRIIDVNPIPLPGRPLI